MEKMETKKKTAKAGKFFFSEKHFTTAEFTVNQKLSSDTGKVQEVHSTQMMGFDKKLWFVYFLFNVFHQSHF